MNNKGSVEAYFSEMHSIIDHISRDDIDQVIEILFEAWRNENQVFICGNGGSASTATHFACDLAKTTIVDDKPRFKVIGLNDNIPLMSAIINDSGFDNLFYEQVLNLFQKGDILICLSVHGGAGKDKAGLWSQNLLKAMKVAKERGGKTMGFSGFDGGPMKEMADACIVVPFDSTPQVESFHLALEHLICSSVKKRIEGLARAVFLDRDGVINELIHHSETGIIDSPFTVQQFRLLPGAAEAIKQLHQTGFKVVLVSNQPGIAKAHLSCETFDRISQLMKEGLGKEGAFLDGEYYCFHHPEAKDEMYNVDCECRKPKPGLLTQAAQDLGIHLVQSWMVGDGLVDIKAGKAAGCRTVLLGNVKCELCRLMDKDGARPSLIAPNLLEAAQAIRREDENGNLH